ncbi:MAG: hypothetical protein A2Y07_10510 [Planctomycetes bacterium GWF2_50_10]|nr:MAG: hypothetical protein A2Y07_10510 [Planctomycetes bacterium GWF2_50_10]
MHVIARKTLREFSALHPKSAKCLDAWWLITSKAKWADFAQVKKTFAATDLFHKNNRQYLIFDIGGNKYRIVASVTWASFTMYIKFVLTHPEYEKQSWKNRL